MFKSIAASSARFNLRSSMERLRAKMGSKTFLEMGRAAESEIRSVVTDLNLVMDYWNPQIEMQPPEKVIRDFNKYLLSGAYGPNIILILGVAVARLREEKLDKFSTLLNYYHRILDPTKSEERLLIQNFVEGIFSGLRTCIPEDKCSEKYENEFVKLHSKNWCID